MSDERVKKEAMEIIAEFEVLPRLVVFDLDYTLWPFYCEYLSKCEMPSLYPHVKGILHALKDKGIDIAVASRSPTPDKANTFLEKLGIKSFFVAQEIFSSWTHKTVHFQKLKQRTGVPYNEMLFFDDEDRNIQAVSKMSVTSILVDDGVDLGALRQGLTKFSQNRSALEKNKQRWQNFSKKRPLQKISNDLKNCVPAMTFSSSAAFSLNCSPSSSTRTRLMDSATTSRLKELSLFLGTSYPAWFSTISLAVSPWSDIKGRRISG